MVDRDGNFVRGLKQEDFQVLEDGKPQKVQTFGMVDIPNTRPRKPLYLGAGRAADRARRRGQQAGPRRPAVPDRARRLSRGAAAQPERPQSRAPLRAREARPRRSGSRGRDERAAARLAGLHAESPTARRSDRQLRRPEAAVVCRRAEREDVAPDGRQRAADRRCRRSHHDRSGEPVRRRRQGDRAHVPDASGAELTAQHRRMDVGHPGTPQGHHLRQRRRRLQPLRHLHGRRSVELQFRKLQHGADRDVGHRVGRVAQQRADLPGRSARPDDHGAGRHRDRRARGWRVRSRAQAAFAGAADVAAEPAAAGRRDRRRRVRRAQRLRRRVRSHRPGEQLVLRARVTTRRTTGATASCATSPCASRGIPKRR